MKLLQKRNCAFRFIYALSILLALLVAPVIASAEVILHAFNWRYADVAARADEIKNNGYKIVLVSPAYRSEGSQWWARYQPQDYRLIDSPLGNTDDFRNMVKTLKNAGVKVYADIIFNHMANEAAQRQDLNYPGERLLNLYRSNAAYYNSQKLFGDLRYNFLSGFDFNNTGCITNYRDVGQVIFNRICSGDRDAGLPDLKENDWTILQAQNYLRALKAFGVSGFRIDAAKHMTFGQLNRIFTSDIKRGVFLFGEIIVYGGPGEPEYDLYLEPYLRNTDHSAYDFPLHNTLRRVFGFGGRLSELADPGAFGQALNGLRAVTFTITHDIPNNGVFRGLMMDPGDETLAYAYIMGRNGGVPMILSDNNESGDNRWINAYRRSDLSAMTKFHNAMAGQDMQVLSAGDCHILFRRGSLGIVGINKCGGPVSATVNMNNSVLWWYANYRDVLGSGNVVNIQNGSYTFNLPARTARMWQR